MGIEEKQIKKKNEGNILEQLIIGASPVIASALIVTPYFLSEIFQPEVLSNHHLYVCFLPQAILAGATLWAFRVAGVYDNKIDKEK